MKRPSRLLLMLLVFVAAGAIVNVVLAWVGQFPVLRSKTVWRALPYGDASQAWKAIAPAEWPTPVQPFAIEYGNPVWTSLQVDSSMDVAPEYAGIYQATSGWPCDAIQGTRYVAAGGNWSRGLLDVPGTSISLPYMALWPGFAINTVIYAALLWLVFTATFALRRRCRIMRGLCPKCAYPVGTNDVCTECGTAVAPPID